MSYALRAVSMTPTRTIVLLLAGLMLCASVPAEAGKRRVRRTTKRTAKKTTKKPATKAKPPPQEPAAPEEAAAVDEVVAEDAEVEVDFDGDDEVLIDEEEEVNFDEDEETMVGEEIERGDLDDGFYMPEYADSGWMLALPMLCVLILGWNVRWGAGGTDSKIKTWPDGAHVRRRPKTGTGKRRRTTRG